MLCRPNIGLYSKLFSRFGYAIMEPMKLDSSIVYLDNAYVPFAEANVSIASSPVLYGLSIYTVFSANWNNEHEQLYCFRLREHYDRMVNSARIMGFADFSQSHSFEEFQKIAFTLLRKNKVRETVLVRVTIFIDELAAGTRIDGLKNTLSMYVYRMGEILPRGGIHACVSSWVRVADNMIPARAKVNGSYVNASLMKNEALLNGYDDAIAIDMHGHVAEGTVANLFLVRDGVLLTPGMSTDILEGITRDSVLRLAEQLGIEHVERSVDRTELYLADEAFMVGSSAKITPVLTIDKRPIGGAKIGPTCKLLQRHYAQAQDGFGKFYPEWVKPVY